MPQVLMFDLDLTHTRSAGITMLTVIITVSLVPPGILVGGPTGACRRFLSVPLVLSVSLSCSCDTLYVHPGSAMKLCVLRDRGLELTASLFADHPLASSVILASES